MNLSPIFEQILSGNSLSRTQAGEVISQLMTGELSPVQIAALLTAWRFKGETVDEIVGAAEAMRSHAVKIPTQRRDILDTCGTGGDRSGSFNISTTTALVAASTGIPVAKHGNRSASSRCGSIDLLEALGVNINAGPEIIRRCLDEIGIGVLFARVVHPAMRYAAPIRTELGFRTIFNLLGPLTNPLQPSYQLIGISNPALIETYAACLQRLGIRRAWVISGAEGWDEITPVGETKVFEVTPDAITPLSIQPEKLGIKPCSCGDLIGGTPEENAKITRDILSGQERGPKRDTMLLNAAAAFYITGKAASMDEGISLAAACIDSGKALEKLEQLIRLTQEK